MATSGRPNENVNENVNVNVNVNVTCEGLGLGFECELVSDSEHLQHSRCYSVLGLEPRKGHVKENTHQTCLQPVQLVQFSSAQLSSQVARWCSTLQPQTWSHSPYLPTSRSPPELRWQSSSPTQPQQTAAP